MIAYCRSTINLLHKKERRTRSFFVILLKLENRKKKVISWKCSLILFLILNDPSTGSEILINYWKEEVAQLTAKLEKTSHKMHDLTEEKCDLEDDLQEAREDLEDARNEKNTLQVKRKPLSSRVVLTGSLLHIWCLQFLKLKKPSRRDKKESWVWRRNSKKQNQK